MGFGGIWVSFFGFRGLIRCLLFTGLGFGVDRAGLVSTSGSIRAWG